MNSLHPDLVRLGDDLEHAVARQITDTVSIKRRRKQRSRLTIAGFAAAGVVALGAGAAAAVGLLSNHTVEVGLPNSSLIFTDTDPTCTVRSDDSEVFDCTLATAPSAEVLSDYTGTKETFSDADDKVAGGCIGQDAAGMRWTCYAGARAVDMDIIGKDLLGQHQSGPSAG